MLRIWFLALVEPLAQEVEHLPFKQGVPGSSPGRLIRLRTVDCGLSKVNVLSNPQSSISNPHCTRPRRLARPRTPAFHVGDTGSNPVGDISFSLQSLKRKACRPSRAQIIQEFRGRFDTGDKQVIARPRAGDVE